MGTAVLDGWRVVCDKPSTDGSAKFNIRPDPESVVPGVLYEIEDGERQQLDEVEHRYRAVGVDVAGSRALTYTYEGDPHDRPPYDWYLAVAMAGAAQHGLADDHLRCDAEPDPLAPGIRPASVDDMDLIRSILSSGLRTETGRDYIHPGDYAWWVHHDDPRHPDHLSTWIQDDSGLVIIDSLDPNEINVFARPGVDRMPLVRWAQRRLDGKGEIGSVADGDEELEAELSSQGYSPAFTYRKYRWDLNGDLPQPDLPAGWALRHLGGEEEANDRRAASHAAFESTMPDAMHLQRYLGFMRSPEYVRERDLVAVDPEGRIASFMVWWADESGVAQIEPFGTHPDYQRRGIGRALIYYGLHQMKAAGMHTCRVLTDDWRAATDFYEGVGFTDAGRVRTWKKALL
jgi:ribosomal protein S18 acetylase RimI-like enzyme